MLGAPLLLFICWARAAAASVPTIPLRNGVQMPMIAAGSGAWNSSRTFESFSAALSVGFTALDTAHEYGNQAGVAQALKNVNRESVFVTTKVPGCMAGRDLLNPFDCRRETKKILEDNLVKLNLSYVDLVLLHYPPAPAWLLRSCGELTGSCAMERGQWDAMEEFYRAGKARAIGVSNYCPSCLRCLESADEYPMVNQIAYHVGMGVDPEGFMTYASGRRMVIQAYGSLGNPPLDPRDPGLSPEILHGNITSSVARAHNKSTVQVALKWIVSQGIPAITKSGNAKHLAEDLDLWSFNFTSKEFADLTSMKKPSGRPSFVCNGLSESTIV